MDSYRLVDLTHVIVPDTGARPVKIERVPAPHAVPDGLWYIMHRVDMHLNHVGTHIEAPYHVREDGMDVSEVPLEDLCGTAAILDLSGIDEEQLITVEDIVAAAEPAGGIQKGDIVLCQFVGKEAMVSGPKFSAEAIKYLVDAGMKLMGVEAAGIELPASDPRSPLQFNHHQLLDKDICLIERVTNLKALTRARVQVFALPIPIQGLDSYPIRLIALETV